MLDTFVQQEKVSKIDFIKIDVEGFEYEVLAGARELLLRDKPIIMVEVQVKQRLVADLLSNLGYVAYDEYEKQLTADDIEKCVSQNIFAIPA
jgi:hypothetical protein